MLPPPVRSLWALPRDGATPREAGPPVPRPWLVFSSFSSDATLYGRWTSLNEQPTFLPTRRVRDAVGPSPAAARVERCVYITNPLMVRPNGSPAPATARQRGFQLPLLIKMFCNQSCGNKHMDMLNLLLG